MANSISVQATVTNTVDNIRNVISSNAVTNTTSSNVIVESSAVTASAWTQLSLDTLADVIALTIWNDNVVNTASVVAVATGSGGQNLLTVLAPNAQAIIPWSGSLAGLYAKVVGGYQGAGGAINGVVQYSAQQS